MTNDNLWQYFGIASEQQECPWVREHQTQFEETEGEPRVDQPPGQLDLGIEKIMQGAQ